MNETSMSDANKVEIRFNSGYVARMRRIFVERAERDRLSRDNYFKKEGKEEERIKIAVGLMKDGIALEILSKNLGLSREELLELARKHNITVEE